MNKHTLRALQHSGARLRTLRTDAGLTQTQLAERAGLSPGYVAALEAGDKNPSLATVFALVERGLGIPMEAFFTEIIADRQIERLHRRRRKSISALAVSIERLPDAQRAAVVTSRRRRSISLECACRRAYTRRMSKVSIVSVRLPGDLADALLHAAKARKVTHSDLIRQALTDWIVAQESLATRAAPRRTR